MKKIGLLLPALLTTSCAYLSHGSMDEIMVRSYNNLDLDNITCSFKNEEGQWQAPLNFPVDIERDGNKLEIVCQNSEVIKSVEIEPKFSVGALIGDLGLFIFPSFCIIGCTVDAATNAYYDYPVTIAIDFTDSSKTYIKEWEEGFIDNQDGKYKVCGYAGSRRAKQQLPELCFGDE